ncbi:D-2-hydroxyacid dehydrogenase [Oceanobacillus alkalisoli]|uniref:D-2-hydroxyacid dehydrogenase n=1 Tax=Oceanobacillus alkalisoli TaxID=2925113 RepID=UPI001EEFD5FC|nr:D-2-hydroxyacid dehydrogenase [Oceanobacillus alkalisoli]MCF3943605.1 D-2-hydroxyacid dehydrogenase [Oceanobacillus alkalisoli]MCG5104998.1 D-2-hydroxyacid dehydrogenase [Oceanobacillus alkalisoli]
MIVFSAKISSKHQKKLTETFPNQQFVFGEQPADIEKQLDEAEVYVTYGNDVTEEFLAKAPNVKWIACLSAGVDGFPFEQLKERGILLTNARGIHKTQMAEYAIAMLLQVYRNAKTIIENERHSEWDKGVRIREITGKTLLILGTGAIGSETARLAKAFHMNVIGVSRSGKATEHFDEVYRATELMRALPQADLIVSVLPSTAETKQILTYNHFKAMRESAVFLNMGRGDVLIEDDLLRAVREEEIDHAVLDVFEEEPLPKEHGFWKEKNITITPHLSGLSPEYVKRALEIFHKNLAVYENKNGELINKINPDRGY